MKSVATSHAQAFSSRSFCSGRPTVIRSASDSAPVTSGVAHQEACRSGALKGGAGIRKARQKEVRIDWAKPV